MHQCIGIWKLDDGGKFDWCISEVSEEELYESHLSTLHLVSPLQLSLSWWSDDLD